MNFLHVFTLFVIDIHQIMLILLFPTPFGHFQFLGSAGRNPKLILTLCLMQLRGLLNLVQLTFVLYLNFCGLMWTLCLRWTFDRDGFSLRAKEAGGEASRPFLKDQLTNSLAKRLP